MDNFNTKSNIDLSDFIDRNYDLIRAKVIYNKEIVEVIYHNIKKRSFNLFKIIESDIKYDYKYLDRSPIDKLYALKDGADDIIITTNGYIKDTSIANIAYFDGKDWITPKNPLLKGTMRAYLIKNKLLLEKDVKIEELKSAKKFALLNAIIGFYKIENAKFI